jgi:hypothetical protein
MNTQMRSPKPPLTLASLSVQDLSQLVQAFPELKPAIFAEAASRYDALRFKPVDRMGNMRLSDPRELLGELRVHDRLEAKHGQEDVQLLRRAMAAGQSHRQALSLVFNRVLKEANDMVLARMSGAMELVLPSTSATRHAIPLRAVAQDFTQEGMRHALGYLDLLLDIYATMPSAAGPQAAMPGPVGSPMRNLEESIAWAYGHRDAIVRQVEELRPRSFPYMESPFSTAVRLTVGLDHVVALEALVNLPAAHELYGRNHLFIALGLAMDAGSVRCAQWLVERGVRMATEAIEDREKQVRAARDYIAKEAPGHGPLLYEGHMHRLRLEVARICASVEP